jgi:hypothetical protein
VAGCSSPLTDTSGGAGGGTITVRPGTPPPFQTPSAPGAPDVGHGIPAINPTGAGVPAFTADDMSKYALNNPLPGLVGQGGSPSVSRDEFLTSEVLALLLNTPTNQPDGTLLGYVELKGDFSFPGADPDHPLRFPYAYEVFDAKTGNLLLWGGLNQPTSTTPPATPTPTTAPVVKFSVSPTGFKQACDPQADPLPALTLTLDNTSSNVAVGFKVTNIGNVPGSAEPWATPDQSSGTVAAGAQSKLTLTPAKDLCTQFKPGQQTTFSADIVLTSGGSGTTSITDGISR